MNLLEFSDFQPDNVLRVYCDNHKKMMVVETMHFDFYSIFLPRLYSVVIRCQESITRSVHTSNVGVTAFLQVKLFKKNKNKKIKS